MNLEILCQKLRFYVIKIQAHLFCVVGMGAVLMKIVTKKTAQDPRAVFVFGRADCDLRVVACVVFVGCCAADVIEQFLDFEFGCCLILCRLFLDRLTRGLQFRFFV